MIDSGAVRVSGALSGSGAVGGTGTVTVKAPGTINATGTSALTLDPKIVTNAGLMEGTGKGGLTLSATTVANSGTILATASSRVLLKGATIKGGTLMTSGTGVIETTLGVNVLDGTGSAVINKGAIKLLKGTGLTLEGMIGGTGVITLSTVSLPETMTIGSAGATLTGGGEISLGNTVGNAIIGASGAATLTNASDKIIGAGLLGSGQLTLINDKGATILGKGSAGLTIDTGAVAIANGGVIEANNAKVSVKSAVTNTGTLLAYNSGTLTIAGDVSGGGVGRIQGGTLYAQGAFTEAVTFVGGTGVLELAHSQAYTGRITGFSKTPTTALDLDDIGYVKGTTIATFKESASGTSGVLTVTDGTHTAKITLAGDFSTSTFTTSAGAHGGTKVVDPIVSTGAAHFAGQAAAMGAAPATTSTVAQIHSAPLTPLLAASG